MMKQHNDPLRMLYIINNPVYAIFFLNTTEFIESGVVLS